MLILTALRTASLCMWRLIMDCNVEESKTQGQHWNRGTPVITLVLLNMLLQARKQYIEGFALQECFVKRDVGLSMAGKSVIEPLVQLPALITDETSATLGQGLHEALSHGSLLA